MAKKNNAFSGFFKRYFIDAMSAMALGLFSSLIIGLIISQLAKLPELGFLAVAASQIGASSPVCGAAIGVAIAYGMKCDPLVLFSSAGVGAVGYQLGGPVGAYLAAVVGAELGQLVSKKTPVDILLTPFVTLVAGGLVGNFVGPYVSNFMTWLGSLINAAAVMAKVPMGFALGALVGMVLTLPISSAALCIMLGLDGIAAGAATAGCCAQMIGFAVISYKENGFGGFMAQGIGTSMLQVPNILKKPAIWLAPTLAGGIVGIISALLGMKNVAAGAGMGTSGLVGQVTTYITMAPEIGGVTTLIYIAILHFLLPAVLSLAIDNVMRRAGFVKGSDMKLHDIK